MGQILNESDFADAKPQSAQLLNESDFADSPANTSTIGGAVKDAFSFFNNEKTGDPKLDELSSIFSQSKPGQLLGTVASVGKYANSGNQQLADLSKTYGGTPGKIAGTAYGALSNLLMPTNNLGALFALGGAAEAAEPAVAASNVTKVVKPGPISNTAGSAMSAISAIPQRYTSAVAADTGILSDATPNLSQVSQKYTDYFNKIGANVDGALAKKWSGKNYFPGDKDTSKLEGVVEKINNALSEGTELKPEDLFMGRSAASALQRSNKAALNPDFRKYAQGIQNEFDSKLEGMGHGELADLGRQWFRAVAKDQFSNMLPKNQNMSPNALRGVLLLNELAKGVGNVAQGDLPSAVGNVFKAGAMSPYILGKGLRYGDMALQGSMGPAGGLVGTNLLNPTSVPH